jgi:hypothetical protein
MAPVKTIASLFAFRRVGEKFGLFPLHRIWTLKIPARGDFFYTSPASGRNPHLEILTPNRST